MYKISNEVINFTKKTMKAWRVELKANRKSLRKANIQKSRSTVIITICNSDDTTQPHTFEIHRKILS